MKVVLSRVPTTPTIGKQMYDPGEENQFRSDVERAFLKLPAASSGGGGGGGGSGDLTAKYLLDTAAADLPNGIVIHRGLGPDRVPASPNALDDEMVTATTGYKAGWTLHNAGTGTVHSDSNGGLCFDLKNDSKWVWLEQSFTVGSAFDFVAKVAVGIAEGDTAVYAGIALTVPGDVSLGNVYWQNFEIGWNGGDAFFLRDEGFSDTDRNNLSFTQTGKPQYRPQGWWYLRVKGTGSAVTFQVSENGVTWQTVASATLPGSAGGVRLQAYFNGSSNPAPVYFQFFRRLV